MAADQPAADPAETGSSEFDSESIVDAEMATVRQSGADSLPSDADAAHVPADNPAEIQWYEVGLENVKGALKHSKDADGPS